MKDKIRITLEAIAAAALVIATIFILLFIFWLIDTRTSASRYETTSINESCFTITEWKGNFEVGKWIHCKCDKENQK